MVMQLQDSMFRQYGTNQLRNLVVRLAVYEMVVNV